MRVVTKAVLVAQDPATVYEHARPDCILCLLMHKISRAAAEEGLWNARQLLQDWLVRALANYNTNMDSRTSQAPGSALQVSLRWNSFFTTVIHRTWQSLEYACAVMLTAMWALFACFMLIVAVAVPRHVPVRDNSRQ